MIVGQALLLKSRFKEGGSSSIGGGAAATAPTATSKRTEAPSGKEQKLLALLSGLDVTPKTLSILVEHDYVTAGSLRMATAQELRQLGISSGQVAEIKNKFRDETTNAVAIPATGLSSSGAAAAAASTSFSHAPAPALAASVGAAGGVTMKPSGTTFHVFVRWGFFLHSQAPCLFNLFFRFTVFFYMLMS